MVVPPDTATAPAPLARDVVFVIDVSGSMGGASLRQARASLERALGLLGPDDRFNIIAFESSHRALFQSPLPARAPHLDRARGWVRALEAGGGTEMMGALQRALPPTLPLPDGETERPPRLRQVVFITDGAVGNEQALFDEIERRRGEARLFTVGIGSAPNSWFMRRAAAAGRGSFTHIGDTGEVAERMDALFQHLASPVSADIQVHWPAGNSVETWPRRVPDLYRGEPVLLAAKLSGPATGSVTVTGRTADTSWQRELTLQPAAAGHAGVAALWARRKIAGLLGERRPGEPQDSARGPVLELALAHSLLSPYTSFVAVEERPARPRQAPLAATPVPNTRPRGQSPQPFAYPQTATTGPARVWLGSLALFLALLVHVMRRPEADRDGPDGA
jgi:Ca-activated chloride channel family protein